MAVKMTEQEKAFWYQSFTLRGRIFFPYLITPKVVVGKAPRYGAMFAFKPEENQVETAKIKVFLNQVFATYYPTIPEQFRANPLKDFNTYQRTDGKPNAEYLRGHMWLDGSSGEDRRPELIGPDLKPVMSAAEVYSGRNAAVQINFWHNTGGKEGTGKKGAGCNLNGVMLMPGGANESGTVQININEVFGSFASEMNIQAPPPAQQNFQQPPAQQNFQQPPAQQQWNGQQPMGPPPAQQNFQQPPAQQWPPQQQGPAINPTTGQPY